MKSRLRAFPWYAILFAIYPALSLLAHNIGEIEYGVAYRALILSVLISFVSLLMLYLVFRDWNKAGILTVLGLAAFFFYGHAFGTIRGLEMGGRVVGRHTYFIAAWLVLFLGLAWLTLKGSWQAGLVPVLGTMSVVLLVFPLYQLLAHQYNSSRAARVVAPEIPVPSRPAEALPDIYFIILDMYGRNDVLVEEFGYDDGLFLEQLEEMGFYVASCSQSKYHSTAFSLSSALNVNYLRDLSEKFTPENKDTGLMWHLIQNSAVEAVLREHGYRVVAFETGYEWTEWEDADYFYTLRSAKINSFEDLLLRNSLPAVFSERGYLDPYLLTSDRRKHELSLYVLDELENVPHLPGPKFVFAHLTIPHPPFVVGPEGEFEVVPPHYENGEDYYIKEEYKIGYRNQLAFLNMRLPQVFRAILENSARPPVILLQGDHGPRFVETEKQLGILNASYFPAPQPELHPAMTPVNHFRLIFNTYFGASLPSLPDRSYVSDLETPYDFREVRNDCPANDR
ncbi:MAG TPA: hypothetical protein VFO91_01410 [Anaerolineales bacterium]|nr:hypothetical protein [Anaerolineales bacterium]